MKMTLPCHERSQSVTRVRRGVTSLALVTLLSLGAAGCSSLSNTQRGALIGAGAGGMSIPLSGTCAAMMIDRWGDQLSGVDGYTESHCDKARTYFRVD